MTTARPARWAETLLVGVGGALGTATRASISQAWPASAPAGDIPLAIAVINVTGALLLGLLLGRLRQAESGRDSGRAALRARMLRLGLGTGFLGGFTTYSALALDAGSLGGSSALLGLGYAVGSLLLGLLAASAGLRVGGGRHEPPAGSRSEAP